MSTFDISQQGQTSPNGNGSQGDLLSELVGEGKKFKSVEDLAKGKLESDNFIQRLQTENKALREAMENDGTPEQVLSKINEYLRSSKGSENAESRPSNQSQTPPLTQEQVLELLNQREHAQKVRSNVDMFNATVVKAFGDKAQEVIEARFKELSMDKEAISDLASKNPQAALKLLGLKEPPVAGTQIQEGSVNTEAFFNDSLKGERQNFAYFQKLRRELGAAYYEPHIQKQVFEQRKKMGSDFWK